MSRLGRFLAGVAALIEDEGGRVLLLRRARSKAFAPGVWECVTGRLQQGEGFEDALHREVQEETRLLVQPTAILGTTHFHYGAPVPANELVGVAYLCSSANPAALRLSGEHDQARWLFPADAATLAGGAHPAERWLRRLLARHTGNAPALGGFELG
ncbi:NUDIX domain-containing protein [Arhodomonas sp. SL1]|uniref:NUDIX domain-containing protein n=1 Tax=Arhodomonas sp. SL1 TaxID=3425691 RepID=UPI003F881A78